MEADPIIVPWKKGTKEADKTKGKGNIVFVRSFSASPEKAAKIVNLLQSLTHDIPDHVAKYVGSCQEEGKLHLAMEFFDNDLSDYLAGGYKHPSQPKTEFIPRYHQMAIGRVLSVLTEVHKLGAVHGAIRPGNVLLRKNDDDFLKVCVGGFEGACFDKDSFPSTNCGNPRYMAPELLFGAAEFTSKVDIWSLGCTYAELQLGEPLISGNNEVEVMKSILRVFGATSQDLAYLQSLPNWRLYPELPQAGEFTQSILPQQWQSSREILPQEWPTDDAIAPDLDIVSGMLAINPANRLTAIESLIKLSNLMLVQSEYVASN